MIKEHDIVVLTEDDRDHSLHAGDVGTVVHIYDDGRAYEVEFITFSGKTAALVAIEAEKLRPVRVNEIAHVRELATKD